MMCVLIVRWKKFAQLVSLPLSQERKTFSEIFIAFSQSAQYSVHFEKNDEHYSLNILEVSDSEKCGYLNSPKVLFQNNLRESMCSRVLNTTDTTMAARLLELSTDSTHIELEKICVSEI